MLASAACLCNVLPLIQRSLSVRHAVLIIVNACHKQCFLGLFHVQLTCTKPVRLAMCASCHGAY